MLGWMTRYARWLHTRWPAGTVEALPELRAEGRTHLAGVYVAGDLTGTPLLKFSLDSGTRAVRAIGRELSARSRDPSSEVLDLVIVGAGVAGMAAALEARKIGLRFEVLEATEPLSTLIHFPKRKPIYTYPKAMTPAGDLQVHAEVKEALIEELRAQVARAGIVPRRLRAERIERREGSWVVRTHGGRGLHARCVLLAIGRSGHFRKLGVPGEELDKVYNRLHDPRDFSGRRVLVVGGGDAAVETAIALVGSGAQVTLVHRQARLSRPKPENLESLERLARDPGADVGIERPTSERVTSASGSFLPRVGPAGSLEVRLNTRVREIRPDEVALADARAGIVTIGNDVVFTMIGREAPLEFLRRSGIKIAGQWRVRDSVGLALFVLFCAWLFDWKSGGFSAALWSREHWFPTNLPAILSAAGGRLAAAAADRATLLGTLAISASAPAFWYTLAYSLVVVVFGFRRIRRRHTPYVRAQTLCLMAIQVFPLFLLPEVILPQLDAHGWLPRSFADALFPTVRYGHGREFWRAYGLILAWPLDVYNLFTHRPLWAWIGIGFVQTCVLIPLGIRYFGKGVYCGWVCSCGALAETLGDAHRHKMPHGPSWNRLNLAGQIVLAVAMGLLGVRVAGWTMPPGNWADAVFESVLEPGYQWTVDVFLAGVVGFGVYFWYSGRVWCRFLCPLAALMHVYARFSRFAIVAEKRKCISCNVCTSVCHQGIDVMSFANKGLPMIDPQCVRCSACVHDCPTGVLQFAQVDRAGRLLRVDSLAASPVRMRETGDNGLGAGAPAG
jgi:thioredoxin reductase/NAD-dependent dihydropyrimidine dehydrogenase PreA subunit